MVLGYVVTVTVEVPVPPEDSVTIEGLALIAGSRMIVSTTVRVEVSMTDMVSEFSLST